MAKQLPWTYSHLDAFESCPRRFYHLRVARDVTEAPSEHITWGNTVHKAFENAISFGTPLPDELVTYQKLVNNIKDLPGNKRCELKFAIDRAFQPADWFKSWSRGISDLVIETPSKIMLMDYKTGKRKPSEQLQLYALYAFAHYPKASEVETCFVWLKDRKLDKDKFHRDDIPELWKPFLARSSKLEKAYETEQWPANPSGLCNGWCPVKQCEFCKEKRR
jgi:hypothetical protein